jgi:hypothetical protein
LQAEATGWPANTLPGDLLTGCMTGGCPIVQGLKQVQDERPASPNDQMGVARFQAHPGLGTSMSRAVGVAKLRHSAHDLAETGDHLSYRPGAA